LRSTGTAKSSVLACKNFTGIVGHNATKRLHRVVGLTDYVSTIGPILRGWQGA
jgi:hypothetical protein